MNYIRNLVDLILQNVLLKLLRGKKKQEFRLLRNFRGTYQQCTFGKQVLIIHEESICKIDATCRMLSQEVEKYCVACRANLNEMRNVARDSDILCCPFGRYQRAS